MVLRLAVSGGERAWLAAARALAGAGSGDRTAHLWRLPSLTLRAVDQAVKGGGHSGVRWRPAGARTRSALPAYPSRLRCHPLPCAAAAPDLAGRSFAGRLEQQHRGERHLARDDEPDRAQYGAHARLGRAAQRASVGLTLLGPADGAPLDSASRAPQAHASHRCGLVWDWSLLERRMRCSLRLGLAQSWLWGRGVAQTW